MVGELVPKRLAMLAPEGIASLIARPMMFLAKVTHPLVVVLSGSSTAILSLLGARRKEEPPVTDDEIKVLMGKAPAGVFHESEQIVSMSCAWMSKIAAIATPRRNVCHRPGRRRRACPSPHHRNRVLLPHCIAATGSTILGVLQNRRPAEKGLPWRLHHGRGHRKSVLHPPLYVPETVTTTQLLGKASGARRQFALIVDEYGDVQGLVTLTDVMSAIVGELSKPEGPGRTRHAPARGRIMAG